MDALRLDGVDFGYGGRPVLRRATLHVPRGTLAVVEGPSGSGKSSLLAVAAGLQAPRSGRVEVMGQEMPRPQDAAPLRAKHIGLVFQHLNLLEELNVAENVELPLRFRHWRRPQRSQRLQDLLQRFGLQPLACRMPDTLSGGEQQRVAIARALAPSPGLLLVDEPTSNLDAVNSQAVVAALEEAAAIGAGVLVATHDPLLHQEELVYRIQNGQIRRRQHGHRPVA